MNTSVALNGIGSIDPKQKMQALKQSDEPKENNISQPNNHGYEVEEFHDEERNAAINKWSIPFSKFPQPLQVNTPLFFNKLEEDTISLMFKFILRMNPFEYL